MLVRFVAGRDENATSRQHDPRSFAHLSADGVENEINIDRRVFEPFGLVVDDVIGPEAHNKATMRSRTPWRTR